MILTTRLSDHVADRLAEHLLKRFSNPEDLARVRIILPTRRACRTLREAFVRRSGERALLMPSLEPLYELSALHADALPACPAMERLFLLASALPDLPAAQAVQTALGLTRLLDELSQFEIAPEKLKTLVPEAVFAAHWEQTLDFLNILWKTWPRLLAARGQTDEAARRIFLIHALAAHWEKNKPPYPVFLVGLESRLPVVDRLLKAALKHDTVFLVTDEILSDVAQTPQASHPSSSAAPGQTHFESVRRRMLASLVEAHGPLKSQPLSPPPTNALAEREKLVRAVLAAPDETALWHKNLALSPEALTGVRALTAATPDEEALGIALILRQTLETPGKTAALVTPDRTLARRVIAQMKRWGVTLDDSAGTPLAHTKEGAFFELLVTAAATSSARARVALLKHPLCAMGQAPALLRRAVREAEKEARSRQTAFNFPFSPAFEEFAACLSGTDSVSFEALLRRHISVAEELAATPEETGADRLFLSNEGKALFDCLSEILAAAPLLGPILPADYPAIMRLLLMNENTRPAFGLHPRLGVLGPIEARLMHPDVCIIGGLNDGVFPSLPETGPWLNRPMRQRLGLPAPEAKIGEEAADFAHLFLAPEVWLTRALKADGSPTIASRFLTRLETVLAATNLTLPASDGALIRALDAPSKKQPIQRPAPCPPKSARPRRLSATKIELWMRNPYAVYARYILKLFPLEDLETPQQNRFFGVVIHEALELFFKTKNDWTDAAALCALGEEVFSKNGLSAADRAVLAPRFEKMARFVCAEQAMRPVVNRVLTEEKGSLILHRPGGDFEIQARADRLDELAAGGVEIIDYKTGSLPSAKEIKAGFAPQLPLEGLILNAGGFSARGNAVSLAHWRLTGRGAGGETSNALTANELKHEKALEALLTQTQRGVEGLIDAFDDPKTPYEATPVPGKAPQYDDYAALARQAEWSTSDNEDDNDAESF